MMQGSTKISERRACQLLTLTNKAVRALDYTATSWAVASLNKGINVSFLEQFAGFR